MAPEQNKRQTLEFSAAPKKKYKPSDLSSALLRCFMCGIKVDFEHGGYATVRTATDLSKGLMCVECYGTERSNAEVKAIFERRIASVSERLEYGESVHFNGILLPGL